LNHLRISFIAVISCGCCGKVLSMKRASLKTFSDYFTCQNKRHHSFTNEGQSYNKRKSLRGLFFSSK